MNCLFNSLFFIPSVVGLYIKLSCRFISCLHIVLSILYEVNVRLPKSEIVTYGKLYELVYACVTSLSSQLCFPVLRLIMLGFTLETAVTISKSGVLSCLALCRIL